MWTIPCCSAVNICHVKCEPALHIPLSPAPVFQQFLPPRRSTRLAWERERKPGMAWCGASPHSASISSPLWFKFNRWEHRRDTAAIKAACYLHIISQSITLTSQGAHFSPARTHPRPTTGPPLCLLCAPACWLGDFGVIWHSTTSGRRVRSSFWSSQEAFIILGRGKFQKKGQLRDGDGVGWF